MHIVDERPLHFLHSRVLRDDSSISMRSLCSIELLSRQDRERDGGFVLKEAGGKVLLRVPVEHLRQGTNLVFCAQQIVFGAQMLVTGKVDDVVAERIVEYTERYYGKYRTNCSTFVEYLRTGVFSECNSKNGDLEFSAGMNLHTTQKIEPGDSLCVLYYGKGVMRRRNSSWGLQGCRRQNGSRADLTRLGRKGAVWNLPPGGIVGLANTRFFCDYHFMYCIGTNNGVPILIYQCGFVNPKEEGQKRPQSPAIAVSVGTINMSPIPGPPACMFIKKGRRKR